MKTFKDLKVGDYIAEISESDGCVIYTISYIFEDFYYINFLTKEGKDITVYNIDSDFEACDEYVYHSDLSILLEDVKEGLEEFQKIKNILEEYV